MSWVISLSLAGVFSDLVGSIEWYPDASLKIECESIRSDEFKKIILHIIKNHNI